MAIVLSAPAAKIAEKVTSATPIMSAAAVAAVRPGWRTLFSRASRPVTPRRANGAPMTEASGRTSRGLSPATARNVRPAPPPKSPSFALGEPLPNRPRHISATPAASMMVAMIVSRRDKRPTVGTAPSRSASTGGTRVARSAGEMDEMTVTIVPTTSATTIVRVSITIPFEGSSTPTPLNSALSPWAVRIPRPNPTADPTIPRTKPSPITDRITCPRFAPSVRSSANSRIRCVTVIENVLKMMNAPTNSAMPPNATSAVVRKLRLLLMSLVSLRACSSPVRTTTLGPSDRLS